jgi:hypothetical protein
MQKNSSKFGSITEDRDYNRVNVFARVRPKNKLEISQRSKSCLNVVNENKAISFFSPTSKGEHRYEFDEVRIFKFFI